MTNQPHAPNDTSLTPGGIAKMPVLVVRLMKSEAGSGIALMLVAALAMIAANSAWAAQYFAFTHMVLSPALTEKLGPMTVHLWVNDGLMALFFLLVGLEIKREFTDGRLQSWEARRLPFVAAFAGMAVPALVYLAVTRDVPGAGTGWAIPAATDIAFAMGVLALLGRRAPTALKLFLVTVAIVDDMGAVAIIALFYTAKINSTALLAAAVIWAVMWGLNKMRVLALAPYLLLGVALWYAVLLSGVHATIAGVLTAMTIPVIRTPGAPDAIESPLHRLEHALHPWSAWVIIPIFGFVNAGVTLDGGIGSLLNPVPLGIAAGLFLGKQLGIFAAIWIAVKTGFARKLRGTTWPQIYGVAMLCGIGFTMSLFIGALAFRDPELVEDAKVGVLAGSVLSALFGYVLLRLTPLHPQHDAIEAETAAEIDRDGDVEDLDDD